MSLWFWKFHNEAYTCPIPTSLWDWKRFEFTHRQSLLCLCPEAEVAGFAILADVAGHLQPPVVAGYQFQCFPLTCMFGNMGIVVLLNNPAAEVCILRNIDAILEEQEVLWFLPFGGLEWFSHSRLFECLGCGCHCVFLCSSLVSTVDISENVLFFPLHCGSDKDILSLVVQLLRSSLINQLLVDFWLFSTILSMIVDHSNPHHNIVWSLPKIANIGHVPWSKLKLPNPNTAPAYLSTHLASPHSEALPGPLIHVHFSSFVPTHFGMFRDLVLFIHLPC
jgi:hypothetical protein